MVIDVITVNFLLLLSFSSVWLLSHVQLFATPWTAACQASMSITDSQSPPKRMSIELVMPSNHLILHWPLLPLPSIFPSIWVFSNESALCIRYQCQSLGASAPVLPMNIQGCFSLGLTGLISMLSKGLSRVLSSTTVGNHQFYDAQSSLWSNSHICKWLLEIALTIQTFVSKFMSLLFNTLSRFVIAFLPRSKHFFISWLQSQWFWSSRK